jgi:hypothetical protein
MAIRKQPSPIDQQLADVRARREQALDLLVRSLVEIDTCTTRIDVLLDRRANLLDPGPPTEELPPVLP